MSEAKKDMMDRALQEAMDAIENGLQNSKDDITQAMTLVDEDETPKVKISISLLLAQKSDTGIDCKAKIGFTKERKVIEYEWTVSAQEELPFTGVDGGENGK